MTRVLRDAIQLCYNFHENHCILVVAFSSCGNSCLSLAFCLVLHQPYDTRTNTGFASPFLVLENWHSGGCQYSQGVRVQVPLKYFLHGCRKMEPWLPFLAILLFLYTLRPRDVVGSEGRDGSVFWFLCTILGFVAETATVSLQTLAFFFPLVTDTFSSLNIPLHHDFQLLIVGNRFFLRRLTFLKLYSFFQDFGWNL